MRVLILTLFITANFLLAAQLSSAAESQVKLKNGKVVGTVINDPSGTYIQDSASKLVWGPKEPKRLKWSEAKDYCQAKKDLGLTWSLPTQEQFLDAFNPSNAATSKYHNNKPLLEVLKFEESDPWAWSSTPVDDTYSLAFESSNDNAQLIYFGVNNELPVHCVGKK